MNTLTDIQNELSIAVETVKSDEKSNTYEDVDSVLTPEEKRLRLEHIQEENKALKTRTEILSSEHKMRGKALISLFIFMASWSLITFITYWSCEMSDAVVITLFTTTLGQVLGLTSIALRWLFPKRNMN